MSLFCNSESPRQRSPTQCRRLIAIPDNDARDVIVRAPARGLAGTRPMPGFWGRRTLRVGAGRTNRRCGALRCCRRCCQIVVHLNFRSCPPARAARASAWFAVNFCVTLKARSITPFFKRVFIVTVPYSETPGLDWGRRIASAVEGSVPMPATVPGNSPPAENCLTSM
ncbi:MAG: hypothetical protein CM1200mP41_25300 [Gammaproteobacteria bacterium]|nr:MAG: hypothetical protein CM1200mP41_25300 [Gammaproteobacteria bacterium]